ncbi:hypothetical protein Avbf_13723 [Armadillidium vulgare]|nr:hypothetical protein Avbf_13723 [Armadillidium vulgare]
MTSKRSSQVKIWQEVQLFASLIFTPTAAQTCRIYQQLLASLKTKYPATYQQLITGLKAKMGQSQTQGSQTQY